VRNRACENPSNTAGASPGLSSTTFVDAVELVLVGEQVAGLDRRPRVQVVELVNTDGQHERRARAALLESLQAADARCLDGYPGPVEAGTNLRHTRVT
jgi:hypothetical protein